MKIGRVTLSSPGGDKNVGLEFFDVSDETRREIKAFITYNCRWSDAPYYEVAYNAHPFIQCDGEGYMFIEFWSDKENYLPLVEIMKKELNFEIAKNP